MENADAVLVLGEDVTQTAPRFALAIRQAANNRRVAEGAAKNIPEWQAIALADLVQQRKHPVFIVAPDVTRLDDVAEKTHQAAPEDIARLGFAIAHQLDPQAPKASALDAETEQLAQHIAATLKGASKALIVSGTGCASAAVMQAAANIARALGAKAEIALALPEANTLGIALMEAPSLDEALRAVSADTALVVLENDLYRRVAPEVVDAALDRARTVIAVDHQATATTAKAHVLFPAGTVFETDGSFINYEGRAQRFFQVFDPGYYKSEVATQESWRWLDDLSGARWHTLDDVTAACAQALPQFAGIVDAAPDSKFRIKGLKLARAPHRYSGRTANRADVSVHEPRQPQDADSGLAFSMEGANGAMGIDRPAELLPFAWAPGWNSPQAWNKFQAEVGGALRGGDPGKFVLTATGGAYAGEAPAAYRAGALRALPLHHIFGSEEQSARCAPIQARTPSAYIALNAADADKAGLGNAARVTLGGQTLTLPVRRSALPAGIAGLPQGLLPYFEAGTAVTVEKV
jgi:NADH-quinone oxidoreductase subunit G